MTSMTAVILAGRDWVDFASLGFTGALVLIGYFGVRYAKSTLDVIKGQLTEIQNAGKQTDRMIEQAGKQAEAAKQSADALINAERAWVLSELRWFGDTLHLVNHSASMSVTMELFCTNQGGSPAWIMEKRATLQLVTGLPKPDLNDLEVIQATPEPLAVGEKFTTRCKFWLQCPGHRDMGKALILWGVVWYYTPFHHERRETRFGYVIKEDGGLERINHTDYNRST